MRTGIAVVSIAMLLLAGTPSSAATLVVGGTDTDWIGDMEGLTEVSVGDVYVDESIRNQSEFSSNNDGWWDIVDINGNSVLQRSEDDYQVNYNTSGRGSGFLFDSPGFTQAVLSLDHNFGSVSASEWEFLTFKVWGFTSDSALDYIKGDWSQIEGSNGDLDIILDVDLTDPATAGSSYTSGAFDTSGYVAIGFSVQAITVDGNKNPTGAYPYVDNVQITPEPATMGLLSLGGLLVLRRRRA